MEGMLTVRDGYMLIVELIGQTLQPVLRHCDIFIYFILFYFFIFLKGDLGLK